ncbi:MAG: amidohydrolase family protein [Betaproteobacteria bacterium]|nr:amidohydrolase family protein [Betaproteobacteria bacterium]
MTGGLLIDGTGSPPVRNATVVVEGDTIVAISPETGSPHHSASERVIDAAGKTILPGLIEAHIHMGWARTPGVWPKLVGQAVTMHAARAIRNSLYALSQGITTVREAGAKNGMSISLRSAIEQRIIAGPRIVACGSPITMTGGHASQYGREADGPDEVRKAAREQLKAGADFIKLMGNGGFTLTRGDDVTTEQLTRAEMAAAVEEAHKAGRKVAVHASGAAVGNAIAVGADSIEHGVFLEPSEARKMVEDGIFLVPTLLSMHTLAHHSVEWGRSEGAGRNAARALEQHERSFRTALDAGVRVATGTDWVLDVVGEMELMVRYGLTPMQAVVAATATAAEVVGLAARIGTIAPGMLADLIVINGNPLNSIEELRCVELVIKNGVVYQPRALQEALGCEAQRPLPSRA